MKYSKSFHFEYHKNFLSVFKFSEKKAIQPKMKVNKKKIDLTGLLIFYHPH